MSASCASAAADSSRGCPAWSAVIAGTLSSAWHSPTAFPGSIVGAYNGTKALASPASPRDGVPILRDGIVPTTNVPLNQPA